MMRMSNEANIIKKETSVASRANRRPTTGGLTICRGKFDLTILGWHYNNNVYYETYICYNGVFFISDRWL